MKHTKKLLCILLVLVIVLTGQAVSALGVAIASDTSSDVPKATSEVSYGVKEYNVGGSASQSGLSFFETTDILNDKEEWPRISPYYDKLADSENTSNFHSHATATYENINGSDVTVDTLYRQYNEALNDPNYSLGMLIYQCIQYKIAHPDEYVSMSFSAFRISPTVALCLNPYSPYYGYMRSLFDGDYDEHGFVRILYLFVEAARLGIDITIVGQLNSYELKQYDIATGEAKYKAEPSYIKYIESRMGYKCYDKYASGKTVADNMKFVPVKWSYDDSKGLNVMHVKTCAVSAYRDKNGVDHNYGVWFSSTNLDAVDYKGRNGNNGSQSGVIISGHKEIFLASRNYLNIMASYPEQQSLFAFRDFVINTTREQIKLFNEGKGDTIDEDELIVYLGTENDEIFEIYFTPLGTSFDSWDVVNNPYCKMIQEFYDSEDEDLIFSWNNPNFDTDFFVSKTIIQALYNKFVTNQREGNRLGLVGLGYTFQSLYKALKAGENIEFVHIAQGWMPVHDKDIMMSYVKNGQRQYVTFISSCNFNTGALFFQTNHIVLIKENESTGNVVFNSLGNCSSRGVIEESYEGMTFSENERVAQEALLSDFPQTVEAKIKLTASDTEVDSYGVIYGNNDFWNKSISYEINGNGNPQIVIGSHNERDGLKHFKKTTYAFDNVNVLTGEKLDLAITIDQVNRKAICYINGEAQQTIEALANLSDDCIAVHPFVVGGDHLGGNYAYFRGEIYELSVWSSVRSVSEIKADIETIDQTSTSLLSSYKFHSRGINSFGGDLSKNDNDLTTVRLWLDKSAVSEASGEYCFAVVGDTQSLSYYNPESINNIYDWLVANKDEKNIEYVIGVGDITELSKKEEFDYAKEQIYKLSGVVPFSLVTGNHDKYDFKSNGYDTENRADFLFNQTFYDETYLNELDGWYGTGDVTCSYNAFEIGSTKWLILNLDFGPTEAMLNWAKGIIETHADHKVIIVTHAYLYRDGTTLDANECYPSSGHNPSFKDGDQIFDELVSKYENIELVLCGHDPWDHLVCSQVKGDNGNTVTQLLINQQYIDKYYSPTEMVALLYFDEDAKTLTVRYYSIAKDMYGSELSQFTVNLD